MKEGRRKERKAASKEESDKRAASEKQTDGASEGGRARYIAGLSGRSAVCQI